MKTVVFYQIADGVTRADLTAVYPRHHERVVQWAEARKVIGIGAFAAPSRTGIGSMGVFPSRADAEEFIAGDPFVREGLVGEYELLDWTDEYL